MKKECHLTWDKKSTYFFICQGYFFSVQNSTLHGLFLSLFGEIIEIDPRNFFSLHVNGELWWSNISGYVFIFQNTTHNFCLNFFRVPKLIKLINII